MCICMIYHKLWLLRSQDSTRRTIICALMESLYALIQNANKRRPFPGSSEVQISASTSEDHRLEWANFAVVYDSPTIRAGPGTALFQKKLEGGEPSDKVLFWRGAIKWVRHMVAAQQVLCSLSVWVTRQSWSIILGHEATHKPLFCLYIITYRQFTSAKTDTEICPRVRTDSG